MSIKLRLLVCFGKLEIRLIKKIMHLLHIAAMNETGDVSLRVQPTVIIIRIVTPFLFKFFLHCISFYSVIEALGTGDRNVKRMKKINEVKKEIKR